MLVMANLLGVGKADKRLRSGSFSFRICSFLLLIILPLALTPPASLAQSGGLPPGSFAFAAASIPTINRQVQEVSLILTVTNGRGRFVRNLTESDFNILDNGQTPDKITFFQPQTNLPLRVALAVDTSDSVTYRFNFEQKAAAVFFRHVLHARGDLGSVIAFNEEAHVAQEPTHNAKDLDGALRRLHPGGETAVYDAVMLAAKQMSAIQDTQPSRHAIILISDGEDNHSHAHLEDAVEAALRSDSVVYVVSTNAADFEVGLAGEGDDAMKQLAEATGGRLLHVDGEGEVAAAFSKIEKELRSQYAIGYRPHRNAPDGLFHRLVVLGPKKLHVFHRLGYFAR
ncbi:MAG TPA: VWA domain-containing protein [Terriglobales bacterium]|nr:VWA domain-containing protein [Terriglobales bacterium]